MDCFRILAACALATCLSAASFEEMQAKTDMADAEAVFQLAQWCAQNNLPTKSRQLYNLVIKIDRDHEGARAALGQVRAGSSWVNRSAIVDKPKPKPGQPGATTGADDPPPKPAGGPGPAAKDVAWNLAIEGDTGTENAFIDGYIARMPKAGNDSDDMGRCVATLTMPEHWPLAKPRLCKALLSPGYNDIYGAVEIAMTLRQQGKVAEGDALLPFVARASERITDPEDLAHFALLATAARDRRSVPRLAELLSNPDANVKDSAAEALSVITRLPAKGMTPEQAKGWWDANWSKSEERILADQLRSSDPNAAVGAAAALCERRDPSIFPVLFKLLRHEDPSVNRRAIAVVLRATGLEFGYSMEMPPAERYKKVDGIEKWWKQEKTNFSWPGLPRETVAATPGAKPTARIEDPNRAVVEQLGSTTGDEAQKAELELRSRGTPAVPALLAGLASPNSLVRLRAYNILREITRQNLPFDPRADEPERTKALDAWTSWARSQKLLPAETPAAEGGAN